MKRILFIILCIPLLLFALPNYALEQSQPLLSEQAFVFSASFNPPQKLALQWNIAPGYYLYRNKIRLTLTPTSQVKIGKINLPPSITKRKGSHTNQIYKGTLKIIVPLINPTHQNTLAFTIHYQGCSSQGFCYSPVEKTILLNIKNRVITTLPTAISPTTQNHKNDIEHTLKNHNIFTILISFLGLGLLLAFTPCVLPMVPILSGIIMGHRKKSPTTKTFGLSLAYVLGMAIMYAIAGMLVALIGSRIQIELQRPWIIVLFSGIFVLLALSLFGVYEFRLPSRWQNRLTKLSNHQRSGTYLGVFLMGGISSLIVSPCVSPALVGVLTYIAHTGDIALGALSLLALGIGMGLPLLLIGASVGKFLPKAGAWMQTIEHLVGILMLAFAIWLLAKVLPGSVVLLLWSILLIASALTMGEFTKAFTKWQHLRHSISSIALIYGLILLVGALLGNVNPLYPLENLRFTKQASLISTPTKKSHFILLKNNAQLNQLLAKAVQEKKWVMLDFSADWCTSCVRMDRYVFTQPAIQQALANFVWLRADITKNNSFDHFILQRFQIIAPPVLLFFSPQGNELISERMMGEINSAELLLQLKKLKDTTRAY
ncbi:MAG: dsbD [Gammaproteobacteria bacterium]|jgi:thiol:disulfide interchange protein DsbD|nr:dsbD [Gammaproteobacteria bacterium]